MEIPPPPNNDPNRAPINRLPVKKIAATPPDPSATEKSRELKRSKWIGKTVAIIIMVVLLWWFYPQLKNVQNILRGSVIISPTGEFGGSTITQFGRGNGTYPGTTLIGKQMLGTPLGGMVGIIKAPLVQGGAEKYWILSQAYNIIIVADPITGIIESTIGRNGSMTANSTELLLSTPKGITKDESSGVICVSVTNNKIACYKPQGPTENFFGVENAQGEGWHYITAAESLTSNPHIKLANDTLYIATGASPYYIYKISRSGTDGSGTYSTRRTRFALKNSQLATVTLPNPAKGIDMVGSELLIPLYSSHVIMGVNMETGVKTDVVGTTGGYTSSPTDPVLIRYPMSVAADENGIIYTVTDAKVRMKRGTEYPLEDYAAADPDYLCVTLSSCFTPRQSPGPVHPFPGRIEVVHGIGGSIVYGTMNFLAKVENGQFMPFAGDNTPYGNTITSQTEKADILAPAIVAMAGSADPSGKLFLGASSYVLELNPQTGDVRHFAGNPFGLNGATHGSAAAEIFLKGLTDIAATNDVVYIADKTANVVYKVTRSNGEMRAVVGQPELSGYYTSSGQVLYEELNTDPPKKGTDSRFNYLSQLALDETGNTLYVWAERNQFILEYDIATEEIRVVAGSGIICASDVDTCIGNQDKPALEGQFYGSSRSLSMAFVGGTLFLTQTSSNAVIAYAPKPLSQRTGPSDTGTIKLFRPQTGTNQTKVEEGAEGVLLIGSGSGGAIPASISAIAAPNAPTSSKTVAMYNASLNQPPTRPGTMELSESESVLIPNTTPMAMKMMGSHLFVQAFGALYAVPLLIESPATPTTQAPQVCPPQSTEAPIVCPPEPSQMPRERDHAQRNNRYEIQWEKDAEETHTLSGVSPEVIITGVFPAGVHQQQNSLTGAPTETGTFTLNLQDQGQTKNLDILVLPQDAPLGDLNADGDLNIFDVVQFLNRMRSQ